MFGFIASLFGGGSRGAEAAPARETTVNLCQPIMKRGLLDLLADMTLECADNLGNRFVAGLGHFGSSFTSAAGGFFQSVSSVSLGSAFASSEPAQQEQKCGRSAAFHAGPSQQAQAASPFYADFNCLAVPSTPQCAPQTGAAIHA